MIRKISVVLFVFFFMVTVAACTSRAPEGPNLKEGLWEITSKMDMKGVPVQVQIPPTTITSCLTNKDYVPQKAEQNQDCKMIESKVEGDTVSWKMRCTYKEGSTESSGKITYKGTSFEGTVDSVSSHTGSGKISAVIHMSGRHIGPCK